MKIDKKDLLRLLEREIKRQLRAAKGAGARAVEASIEAPSFMESQHTPKGELSNEAAMCQRRVHELEQGLEALKAMDLATSTKVRVGSLVTVEDGDGTHQYWVVAFGYGIKLNSKAGEILTISHLSLVGSALMERSAGDIVKLSPDGKGISVEILSIA